MKFNSIKKKQENSLSRIRILLYPLMDKAIELAQAITNKKVFKTKKKMNNKKIQSLIEKKPLEEPLQPLDLVLE